MRDLKGSVALVTGAGRGIGRAFVDEFIDRGFAKVYAGVRDEKAAAEMARVHPSVTPIILDLTKPEQIEAAAAAAKDVTLLVNNAGVFFKTGFMNAPDLSHARLAMEVHYFGPLALCRALAPALIANKGDIVNVLSVGALATMPPIGTYCASKQAARALAHGLRIDLRPHGVRVIAVYPSGYATDMAVGTVASDANPPRLLTGKVVESLISGAPDELYPDPTSQEISKMVTRDFGALLEFLHDQPQFEN